MFGLSWGVIKNVGNVFELGFNRVGWNKFRNGGEKFGSLDGKFYGGYGFFFFLIRGVDWKFYLK